MDAGVSSFKPRIGAIDVLRGLVIIIMVLDHVRDYFHASGYAFDPLDPERTTPLLYATRWITHFCAPVFVFLAGASAWLHREHSASRKDQAVFLFTRGLWLIVLEFTVVGFGFAFSLQFLPFLQVIWAIGWSLIVLAAMTWAPRNAVLAAGVAIIVGHNLLDPISAQQLGGFANIWILLHQVGVLTSDGAIVALVGYPLLPWIGIALFGYGMGGVFHSARRDLILATLGVVMLTTFFVARTMNLYGDLRPWAPQADAAHTVMAFLNVTKYPPSLLFVCITLGAAFLFFPVLARIVDTGVGRVTRTIGSVPLMAYIAHIYLMHGIAVIVGLAAGQNVAGMFNTIHDLVLEPAQFEGYGYPLVVTYAVWALVVAFLYPLCRWWSRVKRERQNRWWLSYL